MEIELYNKVSAKDKLQDLGYSQIKIEHGTLVIELKVLEKKQETKKNKSTEECLDRREIQIIER